MNKVVPYKKSLGTGCNTLAHCRGKSNLSTEKILKTEYKLKKKIKRFLTNIFGDRGEAAHRNISDKTAKCTFF